MAENNRKQQILAHCPMVYNNVLNNTGLNKQGAKIDCFIFACLFSIFEIVSIHTQQGAIFSWRVRASQLYVCPAKPDINL